MIWEGGGEICWLPASIETLFVIYTVRYCKLVLLFIVSWCCSVGIFLSFQKKIVTVQSSRFRKVGGRTLATVDEPFKVTERK